MKFLISMILVISWAVLLQPVFSQEEKFSVNESIEITADNLEEQDEDAETVIKERKENKKKKKPKSKILIPPNEDDVILELDQD